MEIKNMDLKRNIKILNKITL